MTYVNAVSYTHLYPDLVLLPALARLLDTDLTTLLSFQEDLSEKEVALFMNEVLEQIDRSGFDAGYSLAVEKLREYPNSDLLVNNLAALLDGAIILSGNPIPLKEKYEKEIEALYQREMCIRDRCEPDSREHACRSDH